MGTTRDEPGGTAAVGQPRSESKVVFGKELRPGAPLSPGLKSEAVLRPGAPLSPGLKSVMFYEARRPALAGPHKQDARQSGLVDTDPRFGSELLNPPPAGAALPRTGWFAVIGRDATCGNAC